MKNDKLTPIRDLCVISASFGRYKHFVECLGAKVLSRSQGIYSCNGYTIRFIPHDNIKKIRAFKRDTTLAILGPGWDEKDFEEIGIYLSRYGYCQIDSENMWVWLGEIVPTETIHYDSPVDDGRVHDIFPDDWVSECNRIIDEAWIMGLARKSNLGGAKWIDGVRWILQRVDGAIFIKFSDTYKRRTMEFVR